jgi:hypothetical protein
MDFDGDIFGRIYEYFLGKFAMAEGQKGGEFYTPASLVKLIGTNRLPGAVSLYPLPRAVDSWRFGHRLHQRPDRASVARGVQVAPTS